jgi:hypothetical protein
VVVNCLVRVFFYFQNLILKIFIIFTKTNFDFSLKFINLLIKYLNQNFQFYFIYSEAPKLTFNPITFLNSVLPVITSFDSTKHI